MSIQLTLEETRIIGCLMEKAVTTPDQYPLTLNALTNACNQKSSRQPVMNMQPGDVQRTANQLIENHFLSREEGFKHNTEKYSQRLCNSLLGEYQFNPAEYAIICLLLLRGPQTPGELRSRSGRLCVFEDNQQVTESLKALMEREGGAVVARLPRRSGRQDHEYAHVFSGEIESSPEEPGIIQRAPMASNRDEQMSKLEARVTALENALKDLADRLGEDIDLRQEDSDMNESTES